MLYAVVASLPVRAAGHRAGARGAAGNARARPVHADAAEHIGGTVRPGRPGGAVVPRAGQESTTCVFWPATRRHRPSSFAMTYSGLPSLPAC